MTKRNAGRVVIRLDLRGQEELKRRLDELGPAGQRMGRDLEKAMQPVKREGRLGKAAMMELGESVEDVARQAGPLGGVLTALGLAGLAMAAGLGAAALALRKVFVLMERSREAAAYGAQLETVARVTGVATDRVMDFRSALRLADGDAQAADASLEKFAERLGEYRNTGQGEGKDAFEFLGLTGGDFERLPVEDALDRVLAALAEIDDPSRRVSLAEMLGLGDALPLLQQTGDEMQRTLDRAAEINAALSPETLRAFAQAQQAILDAQLRRERAEQLGARATLDLEVRRQELLADGEQLRAAALSFLLPLQERERDVLREQVELLEGRSSALARLMPGAGGGFQLADAARQMAEWLGVTEELNEELQRTAEFVAPVAELFNAPPTDPLNPQSDFWVNGMLAGAQRQAETSLERRRELESLVEQQLTGLMTPLQRVEQLESDLTEARRIGLDITEDQIAAIVAEARERAGLVEGLEAELQRRQEIADMMQVVPRLRPDPASIKDPVADDAPGTVGNGIVTKDSAAKVEAAERADAYRQAIEDDQAAFASTTARFVADGVRAGAERGWAGAMDTMRRRLADMLYESIFESVRDGLLDALEGTDVGGGGGFWATAAGFVGSIFGGGGGAAGAAAGAAGGVGKATGAELGTALLGMDTGADILVGGNPGIDRNVVSINDQPAFRVSAGERMRVEPAIGGGGGPPVIQQFFTFDARNAVMTEDLLADFQQRADQSAARAAAGAFGAGESNAAQRAREAQYQYR